MPPYEKEEEGEVIYLFIFYSKFTYRVNFVASWLVSFLSLYLTYPFHSWYKITYGASVFLTILTQLTSPLIYFILSNTSKS